MSKTKFIMAAFMTTIISYGSIFGCGGFLCPECYTSIRACTCSLPAANEINPKENKENPKEGGSVKKVILLLKKTRDNSRKEEKNQYGKCP